MCFEIMQHHCNLKQKEEARGYEEGTDAGLLEVRGCYTHTRSE